MINSADFKEGELASILEQLKSFQSAPEQLFEEIQKYFAEFDDDNNGFLDRKELRHFLSLFFQKYHIHFPLTDEYVDAVFREMDANRDNKIQPDELKGYAVHFVGQLVEEYTKAQQ